MLSIWHICSRCRSMIKRIAMGVVLQDIGSRDKAIVIKIGRLKEAHIAITKAVVMY